MRHVETEGPFLAAGYDHLAGQSGPKNDDAEDEATTTTAIPLRMTPTRMMRPLEKSHVDYSVAVTADLRSGVSVCLTGRKRCPGGGQCRIWRSHTFVRTRLRASSNVSRSGSIEQQLG